jgi:2,4-dienoyl-CoA reductase-like NADH-dependent reductase (Old Yellow Enzyme family)
VDAQPPLDLFAPARLGPVALRNGIIKAATYEGLSRDGRVTDELVEFHRRFAAGGVGMTTVAYCAVTADGRNDRHQIQWRPDTLPGLRRLTGAVHAEGAAVSAQLGHTGPVASPNGFGRRMLAPSRRLHASSLGLTRAATLRDIERITRAHADAARMAAGCGFDAVEIHCGHNYLVSAFLSPRLNRRRDRYGGSLENRARLAREIVRAVRDALGDRTAIIVKLNLDDGVRGGFGLEEAVQVARWLEYDGSLDALEMTAGSSLLNPMYLFRGRAPVAEFAAAMPAPIRLPVRVGGRALLRTYPYQDAYLLDSARQVRAAVRLPMVLLGGVTSRAIMDRAARDGFQFVAMGRALLREPDLVRWIQADERATSLCDHRNLCMPTIFTGIRCPPAASG